MKKKVIFLSSLVAVAGIVASSSSAFALYSKYGSDVNMKINTASGREEGYYLWWENATEPVKIGAKTTDEHKATVSVTAAGSHAFRITDENDTDITGATGSVTLDILGDYSFCFDVDKTYTHGTSDHTYMYFNTYYTDTYSWGSNLRCYLFNGNSENNTWPGNEDVTIAYEKDNKYGQKIYKVSINAKRYAISSANAVFNNKGNSKTVDIALASNVTANGTGIYLDNGDDYIISANISNVTWWGDRDVLAYYFGGTGSDKWEKLTKNGNIYTGTKQDRTAHSKVIFISMNKTESSGTGWPSGTVSKQTVDVTVDTFYKGTFTLSSSEQDNKNTGSFTEYIHNFATYSYS